MKDYKISSSKNKETKGLDIALEGHLNVSNITAVKKELTNAIKKNKILNITLTNVDDADVTLIQLLVSLRKKYESTDVSLNINFDLNFEISELFSRAGFANTIN